MRELRILLVEDHPDSARALQRLLSGDGHHITLASSVAQALEIASASMIDLLITDLTLPDGSGYRLFEQLREKFPICGIALTGHQAEVAEQRCSQAGFIECLVKPITLDNLRSAILRVSQQVICNS